MASYLGHDVLQLAAGFVGAVIVAEAIHHLLILELVLVRDWKDPGAGKAGSPTLRLYPLVPPEHQGM